MRRLHAQRYRQVSPPACSYRRWLARSVDVGTRTSDRGRRVV